MAVVALGMLLAGSCTSTAAAAQGDDWLGEINRYRAAADLLPVSEQPDWAEGLSNHLTYLTKTPQSYFTGQYQSAHTENPASPYYTSSGAQEAGYSDLDEGGATSALGAVDNWLTAPFHAIGMLRARLAKVGFAIDTSTGFAGLDVIQGIDSSRPASAKPVLFPGPGMTTNLVRFNGGELPSPLETCGWQDRGSVGLPLIALLPNAPDPGLSADLHRPDGSTATGGNGGLCIVDEHTYHSSDQVYGPTGASILQSDHAVLLIPSSPLGNGTYSVAIHQPGETDITWSFSTLVPVPANVSPPSIGGSPTPGKTLSATQGSWSGAPASFAYRWLRCDSAGAACVPIGGASGDRYLVASADSGHTLRVEETASNDGGPGSPATSAPTAIVGSGPAGPTAPGRPGRPGYKRSGTRIYIHWSAAARARSYRVKLKVAGRTRLILTKARHVVVHAARSRSVLVSVRALGAGGKLGPASQTRRIPRAR
ncbi:MAG: hypothetical protein QOC55_2375 [Thermoleophilaceae bacterium]|nr:hypothetical protein [Thermoleophilaceae bacterium]